MLHFRFLLKYFTIHKFRLFFFQINIYYLHPFINNDKYTHILIVNESTFEFRRYMVEILQIRVKLYLINQSINQSINTFELTVKKFDSTEFE